MTGQRCPGWVRERTADVTQYVGRVLGKPGEVSLRVFGERVHIYPLVVVSHYAPRYSPEIFDGLTLRRVARSVDQVELILGVSQQLADQQGAFRRVRARVVGHDDGHSASRLRTGQRPAQLLCEGWCRSFGRKGAVEPAVPPVDETEAMDLLVVARGFDPSLSRMTLAAPDSGQRRMQVELDLVLQVEISLGQKRQEVTDIRGNLIQQVGRNQLFNG